MSGVDADQDRAFLKTALAFARQSVDPNTRVGSIITDRRGCIIASGWNRFPPGIGVSQGRLMDREYKLRVTVHGELSALMAAAKRGASVGGCALYLAATDDSGMVWGGPPCTGCTIHILAAGIGRIVSYRPKPGPSKWHEDLAFARGVLDEAKMPFMEYEP